MGTQGPGDLGMQGHTETHGRRTYRLEDVITNNTIFFGGGGGCAGSYSDVWNV